MNSQLLTMRAGAPWREAAQAVFGGSGSYGNGAAMRAAPLGAALADEPALPAWVDEPDSQPS